MSKASQGVYDIYDSDHPINTSVRCKVWLDNKIKSGSITASYARNFCIHSFMVGKPSADRSRKEGSGCRCRLEVWLEKWGWPENIRFDSYEDWMEATHES